VGIRLYWGRSWEGKILGIMPGSQKARMTKVMRQVMCRRMLMMPKAI
jgi:hypothetical protein